jgi:hypothetical protein
LRSWRCSDDETVLFSVMGGPPTADGTVPPEVVAIFETID